MTEIQAKYKTNAQVKFEAELLADAEEKTRLAILYAEAQGDDFFLWAAQQVRDEKTPAHKDGWNECRPSNVEYWNFNDEKI